MMIRAEWEAEVAALIALARTQIREAIDANEPLRALRSQLVLMAAEGLLADEIGWASAILDVGQALIKMDCFTR